MEKTKLVCIGCGAMGGALMRGAARGDSVLIGVIDHTPEKAASLAKDCGGFVYDDTATAARDADFLVLAVKPGAMEELLDDIFDIVCERNKAGKAPVIISLAAGWTIGDITWKLNDLENPPPLVRLMPNTPCLIGKGVLAYAASDEVSGAQCKKMETLFSPCGMVKRLDEEYMNAATALSGSGPAFVYMFIESLADGAVKAGLPHETAMQCAAQTVFGAAAMALETGKHPGILKDAVASPGGTTIAGVAALEKRAFRGTVMSAVAAAERRCREMTKQET